MPVVFLFSTDTLAPNNLTRLDKLLFFKHAQKTFQVSRSGRGWVLPELRELWLLVVLELLGKAKLICIADFFFFFFGLKVLYMAT